MTSTDPAIELERSVDPGWRIEDWIQLPPQCLFAGCTSEDTDARGPVFLRDGSMHKACTPHWEGIHSILGQQAEEEKKWEDLCRDQTPGL